MDIIKVLQRLATQIEEANKVEAKVDWHEAAELAKPGLTPDEKALADALARFAEALVGNVYVREVQRLERRTDMIGARLGFFWQDRD